MKNRSFVDDEADGCYIFSSSVGQDFLKEITEKGFEKDPKTKAFMDDLKFLLGCGNEYMGTFSEMMSDSSEN